MIGAIGGVYKAIGTLCKCGAKDVPVRQMKPEAELRATVHAMAHTPDQVPLSDAIVAIAQSLLILLDARA